MMIIANLPVVMGSLLIVVGVVLTIFQVLIVGKGTKPLARQLSGGPHGIRMSTTYPGLIMIGLGVLLLILGKLNG